MLEHNPYISRLQIPVADSLGRFRYWMEKTIDLANDLTYPDFRGGMGELYYADDLDFKGERVLIKLLSPIFASNHGKQMFRDEISYMRRLSHPNLMPLKDEVEVFGLPGIVLDVYPHTIWKPINKITEERRRQSVMMPLEDIARIGVQWSNVILYFAQQGLVHGDIKDSNGFFNEKTGMLLAFDLGKVGKISVPFDYATIEYQSPSILSGKTIEIADELYSDGIIIYKLLTGSFPFATSQGTFNQIQTIQNAQFDYSSLHNVTYPQNYSGPRLNETQKGRLESFFRLIFVEDHTQGIQDPHTFSKLLILALGIKSSIKQLSFPHSPIGKGWDELF